MTATRNCPTSADWLRGVTATTGLETAELIQKAVEMTKPDVVIAIDALAARNIERVSTTIQISDTGISPGAGMGNMRKQLNEDTLGARVIAIGVPTVIDSRTVIMEAFEELNMEETAVQDYFAGKELDMVVTSTDIDMVIKSFSDIIAKAIISRCIPAYTPKEQTLPRTGGQSRDPWLPDNAWQDFSLCTEDRGRNGQKKFDYLIQFNFPGDDRYGAEVCGAGSVCRRRTDGCAPGKQSALHGGGSLFG